MDFNIHQLGNKDNKLKNDILNLKSMIKLRYSDIDNIISDINHWLQIVDNLTIDDKLEL